MPAFSLSFGRPPEYPAPAAPVNREHRQRGRRCAGLGGPAGWPAWLGSLARRTPWAQRGAGARPKSEKFASWGRDIAGLAKSRYKEQNDARTLSTRRRTHTRDDAARRAGALRHSGIVRGTQQLASYTAHCTVPRAVCPRRRPKPPPSPPRARLRRNGAAGALRPCRTAPHSGRSWP